MQVGGAEQGSGFKSSINCSHINMFHGVSMSSTAESELQGH